MKLGLSKRISVVQVGEIFRLKLLGLSHREIGKSCGCSAGTVSEYLQLMRESDLSLEEAVNLDASELELRFCSRASSRSSGILLDHEKTSRELLRPGVTLELLWQEWSANNPQIKCSYSHFCALHAQWSSKRRIWMRQEHKAGERVFVDYSGKKPSIVDAITGEVREVELFVGVLGASSYLYAEATESQRIPDWLGANIRMLEYFGGVPRTIVPDNFASAVTKSCKYEPVLNRSYADFGKHYGCAIIPTRVRSPRDKAKVERGVQLAQRWIIARLRDSIITSLSMLNIEIRRLMEEFNTTKKLRSCGMTRQELYNSLERKELSALPQTRYEYSEWLHAKVHPDCHIQVEHHYYSVPHTLVGSLVEVSVSERFVTVYYNHKQVAHHLRSIQRGHHSTVAHHLPSNQQHQREANSVASVMQWAESFGTEVAAQAQRIIAARKHEEQGLRAVLGIIRLGNKYSREEVHAACAYANQMQLVGYRSIKNILSANLHKSMLNKAKEIECSSHENIRGSGYFH